LATAARSLVLDPVSRRALVMDSIGSTLITIQAKE